MGKQWDGGDIAFRPELWAEVLRVLKPGGHLLAFSGSRTYHRMACAIEDAGFEIRDQIMWLYGSGFPKSLDVSKAIDRAAGARRERLPLASGALNSGTANGWNGSSPHSVTAPLAGTRQIDIPATDAARQWQGWGSALKPSHEPLVLARKPLIGTVADNVLAHGTGAINVDGCRIGSEVITTHSRGLNTASPCHPGARTVEDAGRKTRQDFVVEAPRVGRWPSNVIHDGSDEVEEAFAAFGERRPGERPAKRSGIGFHGGSDGTSDERVMLDAGTASRFFYTAKADAEDRLGSSHPTVKPLDLIQYLVRLITPPGGTVLDLFAGTGTTGEAAFREGMLAVLIEREAEYLADIERRMDLVYANDKVRKAEAARVRNRPPRDRYSDTGSLF
jgi:site-specific DNA-methyltransferase (adenine-specific)